MKRRQKGGKNNESCGVLHLFLFFFYPAWVLGVRARCAWSESLFYNTTLARGIAGFILVLRRFSFLDLGRGVTYGLLVFAWFWSGLGSVQFFFSSFSC
jgi:hypothetical protein